MLKGVNMFLTYKLKRVMGYDSESYFDRATQQRNELLLETLISEGYPFDPKHVAISKYDIQNETLDFSTPKMSNIKLKDLSPLLIEGMNYVAESGTRTTRMLNAVDILWYLKNKNDKKVLKNAFKEIEKWLERKEFFREVYSRKLSQKPLIEIYYVNLDIHSQHYIPQNFSVKDLVSTLISKGDFPKTIKEGMILYDEKNRLEKSREHRKHGIKEAPIERG